MTDARRALGARGEDAAAAWYTKQGYELDLIVRAGRTYVFCEVKTRTSTKFGAPVEAVTRDKQMRIRRLAARWLEDGAPGPAKDIRFDVASVLGPRDVEVVEGAF
jgi:putative endonuclease